MVVALQVLAGLAGAAGVLATVGSAIRTVVLPRAVPALLTRFVLLAVRGAFQVRVGRAASYERRDRVLAGYAPVSLLVLLQAWLGCAFLGFAGLLYAFGATPARHALGMSGSSLFTLGFVVPHGGPQTAVAFLASSVGLALLALLITYLPSLYGAFSRREAAVTKLEVRAGSPPTGAEMLWRWYVLDGGPPALDVFAEWESWFVDVEETHTSFPSLVFFRSPQPQHSWVTAAGAVLDGASLLVSGVEGVHATQAELAIRAGYLALRRICDFYGVAYPADPQPADPVSVTRGEWEEAMDLLASAGAPVRADRDAAWADFAGWRVTYDVPLISLAALVQAPYAPWSSDRSLAGAPIRPGQVFRGLLRGQLTLGGRTAPRRG